MKSIALTDWQSEPSSPLDDVRAVLHTRTPHTWTQEEWEHACWRRAQSALRAMLRDYTKAWHDPPPGKAIYPEDVLTPRIAVFLLYRSTGLSNWRVSFNEQTRCMDIDPPPRPRQ